MAVVDLGRDGIDVGIRYGSGTGPGLRGERLFGEEVIAVCAPILREARRPLSHPDDLRHHTLIHLEGETVTFPLYGADAAASRMWTLVVVPDLLKRSPPPRRRWTARELR